METTRKSSKALALITTENTMAILSSTIRLYYIYWKMRHFHTTGETIRFSENSIDLQCASQKMDDIYISITLQIFRLHGIVEENGEGKWR